MISADLVASSPGAGVNHHCDLPLEEAESLCRLLVVDLIHPLNLQEVVAAA